MPRSGDADRGTTARLALLAAALFTVGTNAFVIAGVLPEIAASLRVTTQDVSFSITLYAITVAIASPVVSIVLARMDRAGLMAAGLVLFAVGTVLAALSPGVAVFSAGRFVAALGGAALVPAATAAAPAMVPVERRGRALAIVGLGFTLAIALGSPLGTALAQIGGWRLPLLILSALGLVLAVAIALGLRGLAAGVVATVRQRLAVLRSTRLLLVLLANLLLTAGFNTVYIFSSSVTRSATGGSGTLLAGLLLLYGVGGILGTTIGGRATDRFGNRPTTTVALVVQAAALLLLPVVDRIFAATGADFVVWGVATFAAVVPLQDRLVAIDPDRAGISLSWYSTVMYIGIALAPVAGAAARPGGPALIPVIGAAAAVAAGIAFHLGFIARRGSALPST